MSGRSERRSRNKSRTGNGRQLLASRNSTKEKKAMRTNTMRLAFVAMALMLILAACGPAPTPTAAPATQAPTEAPATEAPATQAPTEAPTQEPFTFGMLLVGAHNDNGWSQAHYDAGLYVEQKIPGSKMLYL